MSKENLIEHHFCLFTIIYLLFFKYYFEQLNYTFACRENFRIFVFCPSLSRWKSSANLAKHFCRFAEY